MMLLKLKAVTMVCLSLITMQLTVSAMAGDYTLEEVKIWPNGQVPLNKTNISLSETLDEQNQRFSRVSEPTIFLFRKSGVTKPGPALLYTPGGGYARVAVGRDRGAEWARLFFDMGFTTVAVLKYRLPDGRIVDEQYKVPLMDAQQALATLHRNAKQWHIDRSKIGVKGASAGGHLAASLSNLRSEILAPGVKPKELRHAFSFLRVPVITFQQPYRHNISVKRLLANQFENADLLQYYSMENQVGPHTPPTFLVFASDDQSVPYQNSLMYAEQLKLHGIEHTAIQLEKGGHGFGLKRDRVDKDWLPDLKAWVSKVLNQ